MADVESGHFICRKVEGFQPLSFQQANDLSLFLAVPNLDSDENVGVFGVRDPVVELGDLTLAEQGAKLLETPRTLGDRDGEEGLAG